MTTVAQYFFACTDRHHPSGCWIWHGSSGSGGYGLLWDGKKHRLAHRIAYELVVGPVSDDVLVLHSCHVRLCVNPEHLRPGTHLENSADCKAAGRDLHARGEKQHLAKLTAPAVLEMRRLRASGAKLRELSERFGVSQVQVSNIVRGKHWAHLPGAAA